MELQNGLGSMLANLKQQAEITSFNTAIQASITAPLTIQWQMLTYMYKTHGILQTAIDMPVKDALRGGIDIQSGHGQQVSPENILDIQDHLAKHGTLRIVEETQTWARLYGGSAMIVNTDQDPKQPFQDKKIDEFELYAASRWELISPTGWKPGNRIDMIANYAPASTEFFQFYNRQIHSSRVFTVSGKAAPYIIRWQLAGWGMSEIERMIEDFNVYIRTKEVLYELLEKAEIDVYKVDGYNVNTATAQGQKMTEDRISFTNQMKNFNRALVLDMKDDYIMKQVTFTGIAEVMKENRMGIASALRMPLSKLFGISATGFNSGEDDIENYNAMVESEVREPMRPLIDKALELTCLHLFGKTFDLTWQYRPLRVMSSLDEETIKTQKHNRYISLYQAGLLSSQEMGEIQEKEKLVPIPTEMAKGGLPDHPIVDTGEGDDEGGNDDKNQD